MESAVYEYLQTVCHSHTYLGSFFKRPKTSSVRPLACSWYYCAQFTAKPKAACALRFSWAATSSNLCLLADMTSFVKPEVHNVSLPEKDRATAIGNMHKKFGEDLACSSEDMIADTQTNTHRDRQTDRHAHHNTPLRYRRRSNYALVKDLRGSQTERRIVSVRCLHYTRPTT